SRYLGRCLRNKAAIARKKGDYAAAENFIEEAIDVYRASGTAEYFLPGAQMMRFSIYFEQGKYEVASQIISTLKEEDFNTEHSDYGRYCLGRIQWALHTHQLSAIPEYLKKGLAYTQRTNNLHIRQALYEQGAVYYHHVSNAPREVEYLRSFKLLRDSLFNVQRTQYANLLDTRYQTEQKEQQIAQLELEDELKEAELQNQKSIMTAGVIGLGLLGIFLLVLFRRNRKITEQKGIIEKALTEKDILLREIHHRVKNNLQLVSSLLGLQGMTTKDAEIKEAINAGKSRVMSMALIHQDLYNKEQLTSVNVQEYLEKLCRELISTYQLSTDQVQLTTAIQPLDLDVETLIPLGLIINELLTNALKYAFPDEKKGEIHIKLYEQEDHLHLEVNDNGIGFDAAQAKASSFGLRLIRSLLRQLDGEMQSTNQAGSQFSFQFKEYKKVA
ncbi:MAG: sensor histidine kinase, partial [Bacteroidota bacterium]